ncbi:Repressor of the inhibitor of the protein kinase-like protein [Heracleum sosnowskyi]|uniref:Repressor of the inhibitor of the protein kinase-like protein n=1 Tax=Heracleum sosnowskyi TaxID=360622 RepID=A0AAD8MZH2_9APIA|nr:Repressor of the inhibitor of the protein kinase-like protein [Heracleum sosnowskyi]
MSKRKEITSYFQPKKKQTTTCEDEEPSVASIEVTGDGVEPLIFGGINSNSEQHPQNPKIVNEGIDSENTDEIIDFNSLIRDPGLRKQIETYHLNKKDLIRRAYIDLGPYQPVQVYPFSGPEHHPRRFQKSWFDKFSWLEYSPEKDAAYCFYCFLFAKNPLGRCGSNTFTVKGFNSWRKVNNGKDCAFRCHVGKGDGSNSAHNFAAKCYYNLKNQPCHLEKIVEKQSAEEIKRNRMRLKTSIHAIKWLTFQACAFRGHDESYNSKNQGNFLEMLKLLASYNPQVEEIILDKAPKNAKYTSPKIQKELLHVFARKVQDLIRDEIDDAKYCLIVDESRDISKREQMAIVVRFVDKSGFVRERFLDLVHVKDTTSLTLKTEICAILSHHNLNVQNIRGQGYDGASNMRALVAAIREVPQIHTFFQNLVFIINAVTSSSKRHDELQANQIAEIEHLKEIKEIQTGKGLNQIGTLQRPGDTRWSSHFTAICSLIRMYGATRSVLIDVAAQGTTFSQRASTATSERAFSAMKIVKTSLRNRMEDEFLRDYLIVYIEKEIAETISTEEIIDSFYLIKERRAHLK